MATKPKSKRAAVTVNVPQTRDDANTAIRLIGIDQRELARIEADMNDELAAVRERYEANASPLRDAIQSRIDGVQIWAEANRAQLTNGYKVKTVALTSGELVWRMNTPSVRLTLPEDEVIANCEAAGLEECIRRTPSLDKNAIKANPDEAQHIDGIRIGQSESFVVVPFEVELAEVA